MISSIEAVEKILNENPKTRESSYNWMFLAQTLREMGFKIFIEFDFRMPSPETLFRERREILNKRNKFLNSKESLGEGVTIEKPGKKGL
jgi:hypothetical protein